MKERVYTRAYTMDNAMEKNKILVLGRAEVDKTGFINLITGSPTESTSSEESSQIKWLISTRYFEAAVEFWTDSTEELSPPDAEFMSKWLAIPSQYDDEDENDKPASSIPVDPAVATLQEHLSDVVDAIVLVFDPVVPSSFLDILPWARMAKVYAPEILLCVAWSADRKAQVDGKRKDAWFEWCVSNGWEWVDLTDDDPETDYTIDRVREALVSNQWSTMVMKKPQAENKEMEKEDAVADIPDIVRPDGVKEQAEWDEFDEIARSIDHTRISDIHRSLLAGAGSGTGAGAGAPLDFDTLVNGGDGQSDEFSAIVSRIRAMRIEISKMTDQNEARKRAAEMAMVLARFGK
ncbi:hypothetical protein GGI15_000508 [Coemansia interrupta]|uniref:Uncharacterized protein n=1 Tax=Coemansia interrupta TaxID=1126814 RepID=A0A9W8LPH0_9FUNG|nr:hypothetical protein GGI15_000508 [Coemansia interrupta]